MIIHNAHIHCMVHCPEVNGQDMKLTTQSPCSAKVKNECNCTCTTSVCLHDVDGENFSLNFFTVALKAGVCMEISLVTCEVNICCFKSVVQNDGSDTVFLHSPLCFLACLDPRAGVDIAVVRKVRTSSETSVRL